MGTRPPPPAPNVTMTSAGPGDEELRRKKADVDGSYTPIESVPSPFQSPVTGTAFGPAYWTVTSAGPGEFEFRRNHAAVDGRKMPGVSRSPAAPAAPRRRRSVFVW